MVKRAGNPTHLSPFARPHRSATQSPEFSVQPNGKIWGAILRENGGMLLEGQNHRFYSNGVLEIPSITAFASELQPVRPSEDAVMHNLESINDHLWERGVRVIQTPNFRFVGQPLKPWEYRLKPPRRQRQ